MATWPEAKKNQPNNQIDTHLWKLYVIAKRYNEITKAKFLTLDIDYCYSFI